MSIDSGMDKEDVGCVCVCVCVCVRAHARASAMEYYSAIKKNETMSFAATWMDLEIIILSKSDRERQIYDTTYMGNLKK